ncbi:uncharacterized protein KGF55_000296 [Candida pseudojiufengensis]|uniref:uncharacterized protein n=1 Tax=Candida pseudojiufengensis TaxID=497109 RepID=UPI002224EA17|nr:uncharacterized protein KGF55_000296 [Candida pseudojiufengensis]KAI5966887.1 hypothetical protein KGF55_000296 [Candida pseudojiufengensis]
MDSDDTTKPRPSIPIRNPSVSFSDLESQERLRRFTISSQPSSTNVLDDSIQPPTTAATTTSSGFPSRQSSLKRKDEGLSFRIKEPSPPFEPISTSSSRRGSIKKNKTIVASPVGPPVPFQEYLSKEDDGKFHILLGCTGSVATIKVPLIVDKLFQIFGSKISIQLIVTKSASHFLKGSKINADVKVWRDEDEWTNYNEVYSTTTSSTEQPTQNSINQSTQQQSQLLTINKKPKNPYDKLILHNELRKWADIMLVAPLSANTLAKISNGIADNLLTSIIRSWSPSQLKKPILVAPAMNTFMYTHPITSKQLTTISSPDFGIEVLKPVEKILVCGDIGMGGMREWTDIVDIMRRRITTLKAEKKVDKVTEEDEEDEEEDDDEDDEEDDEDEDDDDDVEDEEQASRSDSDELIFNSEQEQISMNII